MNRPLKSISENGLHIRVYEDRWLNLIFVCRVEGERLTEGRFNIPSGYALAAGSEPILSYARQWCLEGPR